MNFSLFKLWRCFELIFLKISMFHKWCLQTVVRIKDILCRPRFCFFNETTIMGYKIPRAGLLNPIAYREGGGGGGRGGPCHQTGSQNSRTLSLRVSKVSDFSFMPFGHIVAKFQVNWSARGLLQSFFEQEIMKNKGYEHFYFCLKWLKLVGGYNLGSRKQLLTIKVSFRINKPGFRGLMAELATHSLPGRPTFMTPYL